MPPDGTETLAKWREAGEWWAGSNGREIHRFIDSHGTRRERITDIPTEAATPETSIKVRRITDEKVSLATGYYEPSQYGSGLRTGRAPGVLLHSYSAYAFSYGTIIAGELAALAAERGFGTVLLADPFSLVGAREFAKTAALVGVKPLIGATFELEDGGSIVLVAKNKNGYKTLSKLITECHLAEPRLYPLCNWNRLSLHNSGLLCLTGGSNGPLDRHLIRRDAVKAAAVLDRLIHLYGRGDVFVQIERSMLPWQHSVETRLRELARSRGVCAVAGGPVIHANRQDFPAHDVLVCVDSLCLIDEIDGRKPPRAEHQVQIDSPPRRSLNAERFLRDSADLEELYSDSPDLIDNAKRLSDRCESQVLPGRINLPEFCKDENGLLVQIVQASAFNLYPKISHALQRRIDYELRRITKLGWARHFLIGWEMCEWAKSQNILLSGRGSVVDSVIAYCLGISRIDAFEHKLYFDRFLPPDGSKRPDIDIDFEAARREDVRQHLITRYGDAHVATVCAIGTYGTRGILREVGKVMGISPSDISYLSKRIHGGINPNRLDEALAARPELRDSNIEKARYFWVFKLAERMMDLPRNLRAHSSGVVLSEVPINEVVPVQWSGAEGVKIIQWDKRSSKVNFDKFDVLCLRGNDVLGGTQRKVGGGLRVTDLPIDDPETYRAMRSGQLIGIPQSASPAMRQAHIRIGTQNLSDASIVQAGIRPGVGGAVKLNEYISRRKGKVFRYLHEDLADILQPTLGIVVFQEQIDKLLERFAGYTGDEAEEIRELIQKHHQKGRIDPACEEIKDRIIARGYSHQVAHEIHQLVAGFKGYGFAEGHAFAFAEISVRSIYCQQHYPAPYFAALLDAQPAGYYGPITIANEARSRGVTILPPHINRSKSEFTVEDVKSNMDPKILIPGAGIRIPFKQIQGISKELCDRFVELQPYESIFDFAVRAQPTRPELETLILVGAFDELHANRRELLWTVATLMEYAGGIRNLYGSLPLIFEPPPIASNIVDFSAPEKAIYERRFLGMDVDHHLMAFERDRIRKKGGLSAFDASNLHPGKKVFVVGNPIRLRFPPTQSGKRVMFFDLEDETGLLNVTSFNDVYQRDGHKVICHPYVTIWGQTEDRDGHLSFIAESILAYSPKMSSICNTDVIPIVIADFLMR